MRRMLTDKLTKSIKEVVNAYNEGEFSAVTANPATTTETLTAIEINGTGYAVGGGTEVSGTNDGTNWTSLTVGSDTYAIPQGGSVDIDNKTIVKNADDELETAIGGYKEETQIEIGTYTLPAGGNDYDLADGTLAHKLYNLLEVNTKYDVELTLTGVDGPSYNIASAYIQSGDKTSSRFGGSGALHIVDDQNNEHTYEFYVEDNNNIHIYGSTDFYPASGNVGSIAVAFEGSVTQVTYHYADSDLIVPVFNMGSGWVNLSIDEYNFIKDNAKTINIVYDKHYYRFKYQESSTYYIFSRGAEANPSGASLIQKNISLDYNNGNPTLSVSDSGYSLFYTDDATTEFKTKNSESKLSTIIGGGYDDTDINIAATDFTSTGTAYTCSNITFVKALLQTIAYMNRKQGYSGNYFPFQDASNNQYNLYLGWSADEQSTYIEYTVDSSNISTFRVDKNTLELLTDPTTVEFSTDVYNFMNTNSIAKMINTFPAGAKIIKTVDPKFLPAFNVAPTAAGTYVLKATVDAQGNVTYSWVAEV